MLNRHCANVRKFLHKLLILFASTEYLCNAAEKSGIARNRSCFELPFNRNIIRILKIKGRKIKNGTSVFKYWRVSSLDELELFHGSNITHEYARHIHEEFTLALVLQGTDTTFRPGGSYTARPGSLLLINAGDVHSSKSVEVEYRIMNISPKTMSLIASEIAGEKIENPFFSDALIEEAGLFRAFLNLHCNLEQKASPLESESGFLSTMGFLLARQGGITFAFQPTGKEPHYLRLVQDYLAAHYAEHVSLAQLASLTGLSPYYLLRVFHKQVGCPPHEYQTQLRVARAKKLLRDGLPISDVALETGFFDQSHLSRNFKRIVGISPGQYISERNIMQDRNI